MDIQFAFALHGSEAYHHTVALRYKILRAPLGLTFSPEQLAAEHTDHHLYAEKDGALAACLILTPQDGDVIKMRQVAVDDAVQRMGIGRQLVHYSEDWAAGKGYKKMVLHAREHAVPFYLSLGYSLEGEPFTEVGIPHRKMYKRL